MLKYKLYSLECCIDNVKVTIDLNKLILFLFFICFSNIRFFWSKIILIKLHDKCIPSILLLGRVIWESRNEASAFGRRGKGLMWLKTRIFISKTSIMGRAKMRE